MSNDALFWYDPSPAIKETLEYLVIDRSHLVYLHVNGKLIIKNSTYVFNPLPKAGGSFAIDVWLGGTPYEDVKKHLEVYGRWTEENKRILESVVVLVDEEVLG